MAYHTVWQGPIKMKLKISGQILLHHQKTSASMSTTSSDGWTARAHPQESWRQARRSLRGTNWTRMTCRPRRRHQHPVELATSYYKQTAMPGESFNDFVYSLVKTKLICFGDIIERWYNLVDSNKILIYDYNKDIANNQELFCTCLVFILYVQAWLFVHGIFLVSFIHWQTLFWGGRVIYKHLVFCCPRPDGPN